MGDHGDNGVSIFSFDAPGIQGPRPTASNGKGKGDRRTYHALTAEKLYDQLRKSATWDLSMLHASAVSAIYDYEDGITLSFREFLFSSPKAALGSASQLDRSMLTGKKYPAFTRSL